MSITEILAQLDSSQGEPADVRPPVALLDYVKNVEPNVRTKSEHHIFHTLCGAMNLPPNTGSGFINPKVGRKEFAIETHLPALISAASSEISSI